MLTHDLCTCILRTPIGIFIRINQARKGGQDSKAEHVVLKDHKLRSAKNENVTKKKKILKPNSPCHLNQPFDIKKNFLGKLHQRQDPRGAEHKKKCY